MAQYELQFFLIDDDLDDHEFFIHALKKVDTRITCKTVTDGRKALEYIKVYETFIPDFIFLDLNMPRLNGKECLLELIKIERLNTVPIYIYTTSSSENDKIETLEIGATGFITKPNSPNVLVEILTEIISPFRKG